MLRLLLALTIAPYATCQTISSSSTEPCGGYTANVAFLAKKNVARMQLQPDAILADLDGKPAKTEALTPVSDSAQIILLLDVSGSMRMKWKYELAYARAFVSSMQDDDEIGLMAFNERIVSQVPVSRDRQPINAELKRLIEAKDLPWGPSSVADSLNKAIELLPASKNRAIYLITDAGDNSSREPFKQLLEVAQKSSTRIFALVMGDTELGSSKSSMGKLRELARATGGDAFEINEPDDRLIQKAATAMKTGIDEPVKVSLQAKGATMSPKLHIRFASSKLAKEFTILAPEIATSACTSQTASSK